MAKGGEKGGMPEIRFLPDGVRIRVKPGTTLLEAARKARVPVRTRCGGMAGCLMCKVKVADQQGLGPLTRQERIKLGPLAEQGVRLACQARICGDVAAEVPEDPLKAAVRRQLQRLGRNEAD